MFLQSITTLETVASASLVETLAQAFADWRVASIGVLAAINCRAELSIMRPQMGSHANRCRLSPAAADRGLWALGNDFKRKFIVNASSD